MLQAPQNVTGEPLYIRGGQKTNRILFSGAVEPITAGCCSLHFPTSTFYLLKKLFHKQLIQALKVDAPNTLNCNKQNMSKTSTWTRCLQLATPTHPLALCCTTGNSWRGCQYASPHPLASGSPYTMASENRGIMITEKPRPWSPRYNGVKWLQTESHPEPSWCKKQPGWEEGIPTC